MGPWNKVDVGGGAVVAGMTLGIGGGRTLSFEEGGVNDRFGDPFGYTYERNIHGERIKRSYLGMTAFWRTMRSSRRLL